MIIGWAKGGGSGFVYPSVAGVRTGTGNARFIVLEIHLDNPSGAAGKVITSGFKIHTTTTPRQFDVGTLVSVSILEFS
jgi:hypothetical protein